MKHILELTEEDACDILKGITQAETESWEIHFTERNGHLRLDEEKPIVCDELNLLLLVENLADEIVMPEHSIPNHEIIGIYGDDEFAWVCRKDDGGIVEIDQYDFKNSKFDSGVVFPSLSHYLLFVADYKG